MAVFVDFAELVSGLADLASPRAVLVGVALPDFTVAVFTGFTDVVLTGFVEVGAGVGAPCVVGVGPCVTDVGPCVVVVGPCVGVVGPCWPPFCRA